MFIYFPQTYRVNPNPEIRATQKGPFRTDSVKTLLLSNQPAPDLKPPATQPSMPFTHSDMSDSCIVYLHEPLSRPESGPRQMCAVHDYRGHTRSAPLIQLIICGAGRKSPYTLAH
jgi:hypothetical protein